MKSYTKTVGVGFATFGLCLGGVAAFGAGSASAAGTTTTTIATTTTTIAGTTTTTKPPAIPAVGGLTKYMALYVDTVQGGGGTPAALAGCSQSSVFQVGQVIVFRMYGEDLKTGKTLLVDNVKSVNVTVAGPTAGLTTTYPMTYSVNDGYWTYGLNTKLFSPGYLNFKVVATTMSVRGVKARKASPGHKAVRAVKAIPSYTGTFTQTGLASESQLQVIADYSVQPVLAAVTTPAVG
jgi:hypothetical protein